MQKMSPQLMAISTGNEWWVHWLVVYLPLWRIWKSVGTMKFPIYGKIQNVPNHQPVKIGMYGSKPEYHWQALVTARSNPSILGINNLIHIVTIVIRSDSCSSPWFHERKHRSGNLNFWVPHLWPHMFGSYYKLARRITIYDNSNDDSCI